MSTFWGVVSKKTLIVALVASTVAACSKPKKPKDDDDDDEPRRTKTSESSSARSSASPSDSSDAPTAGGLGSAAVAEPSPPRPATAPSDALLLSNGDRRVAVSIKPDGETKIFSYMKDGSAIDAEKVHGKLRAAAGKWIDVKGEDDAVTASIAKLEEGLTTVELALSIDGKDFNDAIAVPEGGTKALSEEPKIKIPEGTRGPNGGLVEVVGDQRIELVVDEKTNDMRVYFLNDKLEVMEIPKGTEITLNIDDEGKKK